MPRVAVCFAGLPRLNHATVVKWQQFINKYNADVFVHTWQETTAIRPQIVNHIAEAFAPKQLIIEPVRQFNTARFSTRIWPHRSQPGNVLSMWYSISRSVGAALNWDQYDIVCRARFDWWCDSIELTDCTGLTVPDDPGLSGHHFTYKGEHYIAHNDQFGYGSADVMQTYASTYDRIPWLYSDDGVDFCSELFLTANMISYNIPVTYQQNMNYRIVK
jgi:hypothetical protein